MEKRDLSFKNFISIFFKNLTFDKISEDDFNNNETDYYKNSETDSFKGGKYNFNNDILKLKLEIPNTVTTQFDDLESKLNDMVKKSDKLIPKIQKQLNKRNNDYEQREEAYKHIKFFGGNRKYDWLVIHRFKGKEPTLVDMYSSTTRFLGKRDDSNVFQKFLNIIDDWFPLLYALTWNKKNFNDFKEKDKFLFFDFVNIR